ncbi:MAG: hypothetical protein K2G13_09665, partial [Muribaculaceae bacterium]|nr:hypothetical protein [Muribaculaceae bacterium]
MQTYPDSALAILEAIDPSELTQDSIKAKYYYVLASSHDEQGKITLSDSMISFSNDYYRGKDLNRSIQSATLLASYKFRIGERDTARRMLDSLLLLKNVPDSLLIKPLINRIQLWAYDEDNESHIRHLLAIDKDENHQIQYKFWLYFSLIFNGKNDSALAIIDELIDCTGNNGDNKENLIYKYEKIVALMEMALYEESIELADSLINDSIDQTATPYFHLWKSLGMLNMQKIGDAATELELADSLASDMPADEQRYFNSFAIALHTVLDYHKTGKVSFIPFSKINNPQRDYLHEEQIMRQEAARRALEIENQRLILKSKSDRQTALLIIVVLGALLISGAL